MMLNEPTHETDLDLNHSTSKPSIKSQLSLQNGKVFQTIFENASEYGLTKSDQEVLLEGRQTMITYTRLGFIIGAMIAPLPLFWKSKPLSSLPPLISSKTKQPDLRAIKARVWWISKSVLFTTFGSALGSWFGFYFGLKRLNWKIDKEDGFRHRFEKALEDATGRIGGRRRDDERLGSDSGLEDDRDGDEEEKSKGNHDSISNLTKSRWEELRKEKFTKPSTWDEIREKHYKSKGTTEENIESTTTTTPRRILTKDQDEVNLKELQRIEFEELLEKERRICNENDERLK